MNRPFPYILILLFALTLTSLRKDPPQRAYKLKIDEYIHDHPEGFRYYSMTKTSAKPLEVGHVWPENQVKSYSIFHDPKGKILFAMIGEENDWGDYAIQYRYYFDKEGRTETFERLARFYHSVCINNDAVLESRVFYYDKSFKRIGQDFSMHSAEGKKLDSLDCDFPYNFPYPIYKSWEQLRDTSALP